MATNIIISEDLEQFKCEFLELIKQLIDSSIGKVPPMQEESQWLKSHQVQRMRTIYRYKTFCKVSTKKKLHISVKLCGRVYSRGMKCIGMRDWLRRTLFRTPDPPDCYASGGSKPAELEINFWIFKDDFQDLISLSWASASAFVLNGLRKTIC